MAKLTCASFVGDHFGDPAASADGHENAHDLRAATLQAASHEVGLVAQVGGDFLDPLFRVSGEIEASSRRARLTVACVVPIFFAICASVTAIVKKNLCVNDNQRTRVRQEVKYVGSCMDALML